MDNSSLTETKLRIVELCVFVGIAINCISCFFGASVCEFFYNISGFTAAILLIPIVAVFYKDLMKNKLRFFIILGFFVFTLFSSLFYTGLNVSYCLTASLGIFTLFVMSEVKLGNTFRMVLITFFSVLSVVLLFEAINFAQKNLVERWEYTNPNVLAICAVIVNSYLMVLISTHAIKGKFIHINFFIGIFGFLTVTLLECRSCQLAFLGFVFVSYVCPILFCGKKRCSLVILCLMLLGGLFPVIYTSLSGFNFPFVNKPWFSGRDVLWFQALDWLKATPLSLIFGIGSNFVEIPLGFNFHNSYISVLACFGIPSTLAYFYSVFVSSVKSIVSNEEKKARALQCALIIEVLVISLTETTIPATTFIWLYGLCFIPLRSFGGAKKEVV